MDLATSRAAYEYISAHMEKGPLVHVRRNDGSNVAGFVMSITTEELVVESAAAARGYDGPSHLELRSLADITVFVAGKTTRRFP
jgi:hypothetical protein